MVSVNKINCIKYDTQRGIVSIEDKLSNILSKANIIETPDRVCICQLKSYVKNKGYGAQIIDFLKEKFAKPLTLNASWIDEKPPHKFYIQQGFKAEDKTKFDKLKTWIADGAKSEDFPFPRCNSCCQMILEK